jgi:hypothetical protein
MRILDGEEDVAFFVAQTPFFSLGWEHHAKGSWEGRKIASFLKLSLL